MFKTNRRRAKLVTRYTADKGTAHRAIAKGTMTARAGHIWMIFATGVNKGYALELPTSEFKYRGKYIDQLAESLWLSDPR